MKLRFAGTIIRLDKKSSQLAIGDYSLQTRFETASAPQDNHGAGFTFGLEAVILAALWRSYCLCLEMEVFKSP